MAASWISFWIFSCFFLFLLSHLPGSSGYLSTSSRFIIDEAGNRVKLACVNWYGAEEKDFIVGGLHVQTAKNISSTIKKLGFNCIRLPISLEGYISNPILTNQTVLAVDKSFLGKSFLNALDQLISILSSDDLLIIIDDHMSNANWCCSDNDGNGLWYTDDYPEDVWIKTLAQIAQRYQSNPNVVGIDLRNELRYACQPSWGSCRTPTWGSNVDETDWRLAATKAGNSILAVNPNLLIIVEAINYATDLTGASQFPIQLSRSDKLVYEVHDYPWFHTNIKTADDLYSALQAKWAFILEAANPVPILVGEFGTCHTSPSCVSDSQPGTNGFWMEAFVAFLAKNDLDWSYWAIDGTVSTGDGRVFGEEEVFGVLDKTWSFPASKELMDALKSIQGCAIKCTNTM